MKAVAQSFLIVLLIVSMVACTTDQILADLNLALQIAVEIIPTVATISPADAMAMQRVSAIAQQSLQVIINGYNAYKQTGTATNLQTLESALDAFKGQINAAIAVAQIKNPASVAKITAWANLIYSVTDAILSAIPQAKSSGKASVKTMKKLAVLPKPEDLKMRWAAIK